MTILVLFVQPFVAVQSSATDDDVEGMVEVVKGRDDFFCIIIKIIMIIIINLKGAQPIPVNIF